MEQLIRYKEVIDWIKEEIASGSLKEGDRLLSEKEIAARFGMSRQTVRHATGELEAAGILKRIRGSGTYVGDPARYPSREKHNNIAVISTYVDSYIFPATLRGIESVLSGEGYTMQIAFTDDLFMHEENVLKGILEKDNVDGVIVEPAKSSLPNPNLGYYRLLQERGIPIIFFNAAYNDLNIPCVRMDDSECGKRMTELLIRAGHKNIGGIFHAEDGQGRLRYSGFVEAMREAGLPIDPRKVLWIDSYTMWRLETIQDVILDRMNGCTGIMCYNDEVASRLINMFQDKGIRVPEDVSLVSIDDSSLASLGAVPFTSCVHPKEELGRKVAGNLLGMINNRMYNGNYLFRCEPVERESVRKV